MIIFWLINNGRIYHSLVFGNSFKILYTISLVMSIWYSLSIFSNVPFHTFISPKWYLEPMIINLLLALVNATFNLLGSSMNSWMPLSINKIIISLSIPWLLSIVKMDPKLSSITFYFLRILKIKFIEAFLEAMIAIWCWDTFKLINCLKI